MSGKPADEFREWLAQALRTLKPGERLPMDSQLAVRFGLSVKTVKRELEKPGDQGRLWRIQRKGTFICRERSSRDNKELYRSR